MITPKDIRVGMLLKVNPGARSHCNTPYIVEVISVDSAGFYTQLNGPPPINGYKPHVRRFDYSAPEWKDYHQKRFEFI